MKIQSIQHAFTGLRIEECPASSTPEFAFIGRSNVGKSSLLNSLTNEKALVKVSNTPGRTRAISIYTVNKRWNLVDLPGYGFANAPKPDRERFADSITDYLVGRENLTCAFILIDARHAPQKIDLDFVRWTADHDVPFALVFTKADKVKRQALKSNVDQFKAAMAPWHGSEPRVFVTSAKDGTGRGEILHFVDESARK